MLGLGLGFAALGCGLGLGLIGYGALTGMARQPEAIGKLQVVMPVYRSSQMGVLTVRSEAELSAQTAAAMR